MQNICIGQGKGVYTREGSITFNSLQHGNVNRILAITFLLTESNGTLKEIKKK